MKRPVRLSRIFIFLGLAVLFFSFIIPQAYAAPVACDEILDPLSIGYGDYTEGRALETGTDMDPTMSVRDPSGAEVASSSCVGRDQFSRVITCGFAINQTLAMSGVYTVIVAESGLNEAGDYEITATLPLPIIRPGTATF